MKVDLGMLPTQTDGLGFRVPVDIDVDSQLLGEEEALFHNQPFFDDGNDNRVAFMPDGRDLADELTDGHAVDGYILARQQGLNGFIMLGDGYVDLGEARHDLALIDS